MKKDLKVLENVAWKCFLKKNRDSEETLHKKDIASLKKKHFFGSFF